MPSIYHLLLLLLCIGTGCSSNKNWISAQIYPYGKKNLASYQLDTPDSLKATQDPTELLTIEWKIASKPHLEMNSYYLQAHIRFKDGSEKSVETAIHTAEGSTIMMIDSKDHKARGEITSYKIDLFDSLQKLATSRHKLWIEQIIIEDS